MAQNNSHAVMSQRKNSLDELDDFPTPPWATRALIKYVINDCNLKTQSCLEPACNVGHMSSVLKESFRLVKSSDIYDYGYGEVCDYLKTLNYKDKYDWVITNPPF